MKWLIGTIIALNGLVFAPLAEPIDISLAEVQNGVAVVQGNKAAKQATIVWDNSNVGQTTKGGSFTFAGVVPVDCVGQLSIGSDTINVALDQCTPVAGAPAPVAQTGQTQCWDPSANTSHVEIPCANTGLDGDIQAGVPIPNPRFTNNLNGTVTDNLTGLLWLKNANCFGAQSLASALHAANTLASGGCGLSDGSVAGDWRLPNIKELQSLIHYGFLDPALSNAAGTGHWAEGDPFTAVLGRNDVAARYWSSTGGGGGRPTAWTVAISDGLTQDLSNGSDLLIAVWPVRGPQASGE